MTPETKALIEKAAEKYANEHYSTSVQVNSHGHTYFEGMIEGYSLAMEHAQVLRDAVDFYLQCTYDKECESFDDVVKALAEFDKLTGRGKE